LAIAATAAACLENNQAAGDIYHLLGVVEDGGHDGDEAHLGGEVDDAQQRLELLQRHDDGGAGHEAHQRRLRQEVDDEP
jgi:hypothetical protein